MLEGGSRLGRPWPWLRYSSWWIERVEFCLEFCLIARLIPLLMRHRLVRLVGALRSAIPQEYLTNIETFWIMLANLDLTFQ